MTQSWNDLSEIVTGLILREKIPFIAADSSHFISPYDEIIKEIKASKSTKVEKLIEKIGLMPIQTAFTAADSLDGISNEKIDWLNMLEIAYVNQEIGNILEKAGRRLQKGQSVDSAKLIEAIAKIDKAKTNIVRMSDVKATKIPFIHTGWRTWDYHFGGIPASGLVLIAAPPKTGKTSTLAKLGSSFVQIYPEKSIGIFTLEMTKEELKTRFLEIDKLEDEQMERIYLCDEILSVEEIANKAASIDNVGMVMVDFADLMIDGTVDTGKMENVYRVLTIVAKRLKIPVVLLAQLSGNYQGGIPRPIHIRWTRLAEALAWMLVMLYSPTRDYFAEKDKTLIPVPGKAYIICWLCRGGFRKHPGPGAIQLGWNNVTGWDDSKGRWFSLTEEDGDNA